MPKMKDESVVQPSGKSTRLLTLIRSTEVHSIKYRYGEPYIESEVQNIYILLIAFELFTHRYGGRATQERRRTHGGGQGHDVCYQDTEHARTYTLHSTHGSPSLGSALTFSGPPETRESRHNSLVVPLVIPHSLNLYLCPRHRWLAREGHLALRHTLNCSSRRLSHGHC